MKRSMYFSSKTGLLSTFSNQGRILQPPLPATTTSKR